MGMQMLLPAAIHGVPRGVAAAAAAIGCLTTSSPSSASAAALFALGAAAFASFAGLVGASASYLFIPQHSTGILYILVLSCGFLAPASLDQVLLVSSAAAPMKRGVLDRRRALLGALLGLALVVASLAGKHTLCSSTSFCNAAPEALT
eukprot:TRINITY_DN12959_c0_g1_i1.p1 TRINITY_DN12959_c0_g1~~TRINITY_DN12959_c0_g1_i1.p1  ORF type:complete len:161 (-),score=3.85 TRINITY_DN12959_c0_g1_i1:164-607(-)